MKVDSGWTSESLGKVASITMGQSPDSKFYSEVPIGLPFLQGSSEFRARTPNPVLFCSQVKKVAEAGSILFSVRAPVGKINIADKDYIIGRGLSSILATKIDQAYLEYYLRYCEAKFQNASQGSTFEAVNSSELNDWKVSFPISRMEQSKIAEVLSTVDRAIEQTEALIAKQQRIRTGLMQDLLTRGIDEHGKVRSEETHQFKDSPLGRIPGAWKTERLNDCVQGDGPICYGILMPGTGFDNGVPVIKVKDIVGGKIIQSDLLRTDPKIDDQYKRSRLQPGDLLLTIRGTTGRIAIVPTELDKANITQDTARIRLKEQHSIHYLYFLLQSKAVQDQIALHTLGQAVKGINISEVKNICISLPSQAEQQAIAKTLLKMEASLNDSEQQLKKLHLIKTALMQDLLTGEKSILPLLKECEVVS